MKRILAALFCLYTISAMGGINDPEKLHTRAERKDVSDPLKTETEDALVVLLRNGRVRSIFE